MVIKTGYIGKGQISTQVGYTVVLIFGMDLPMPLRLVLSENFSSFELACLWE